MQTGTGNQRILVGEDELEAVQRPLKARWLTMGEEVLKDRSKRRRYGLGDPPRMAKLEDETARAHHYLRHDSDWVNADLTVTTDADQVPVAPGYQVEAREAGGRRTIHTRTEAPIHHFFSIQSARYVVKTEDVGGVAISVLHHPDHPYVVDRMLAAMRRSLEIFGREFSPFQFRQLRILEFPAYATFAQSFANTIPFSEGIGFVADPSDPEKVDFATYVTAHEVAHQWFAHQLVGADAQGATMLSETFSQYGALLVMESLYGKAQVRQFLKYELDEYLRSRGGELVEELPLARVEDQGYIHYQKGTLVMAWLREVVGEAAVNRAIRRLVERYAFRAAPYPTTADFLALLREEAPGHEALISDQFEKITLYDLNAKGVKVTPRADGRFDVALELEATKRYATGEGVETEAPMDEPVEVGAFAAEPGKKGFSDASVLALERRRIVSGPQTVVLVTDRAPAFVGVDPFNKRIDRNSDDNLVRPGE
jgi:aminopeptidase N